MRIIFVLFTIFFSFPSFSQSYTYYRTGDTTDVSPTPVPGTCLMGGATEHDNAMIWFLQRASEGNVLVIRASGSNGYNNYLYSELGVTVQSVETIVFNSSIAAEDPFVLERIAKAEAIWIAGGNQWNYVSYWKDSSVGQLLNEHILTKQAPIGGTSAGMAILGGTYFSAQNGTITSSEATNNPFAFDLTLGFEDFLHSPFLEHVIPDTHYDDPDRRGRHMAFLARLATDHGVLARGIACDEYTAICIDEHGMAHTYGEYPAYNENVYFLEANCEGPLTPEVCEPGSSLTWNRNNAAVKVYHIQPDLQGSKSFDMSDWITGVGGQWENWWIVNGTLQTADAQAPDCATALHENNQELNDFIDFGPEGQIILKELDWQMSLYDMNGQMMKLSQDDRSIDVSGLAPGIYLLSLTSSSGENIASRISIP